jgi:peptidoglycan/xylan/chitin deacetylase (PgdA/CDA1 family)
VGAALGAALLGGLVVVGGHDVSARTQQPERSANSLFGPAPGDQFGTTPPSGSARGSALPGLATPPPSTAPERPTGTDGTDGTDGSGGQAGQPGGQQTAGGQQTPGGQPTGGSAPASKVLHLTFDDGPDPTWTPQVLAVLRQYGVHATFFELGVQVRDHPSLPALIRADGHAIGNHTYDHKSLPSLDDAHLRGEIDKGPSATCLRPPFGAVNSRVRTAAARAGQQIVLWDVDTRDWSKPGVPHIVNEVLTHAHPGATVLMHDAGGDRSETVAALRIVLPKLIAQGYTFATVPGC